MGAVMKIDGDRNSIVVQRSLRAVLLLLLVGALGACDQKPSAQSPQSLATSPAPAAPRNGRYAIVFNPNVRADTFLLDTQSGKVWHQVKYADLKGQPTVWELTTVVDSGPEESRIPGSLTFLELLKLYQTPDDGKSKK